LININTNNRSENNSGPQIILNRFAVIKSMAENRSAVCAMLIADIAFSTAPVVNLSKKKKYV
jgi:hypothetical protein